MLHEVRIYTPEGKLKKMISKHELSKKHWNEFKELSNDLTIGRFTRGRVPKSVREILAQEFPEFNDESR